MDKTTKTGFGGGRLQLQPGAMQGSLQYAGDLPGWIHDVVWPAIMKAAKEQAKGDPELEKSLRQSLLAKIAPNRNAAKVIQMFGDEGFATQIGKDLGLAEKVEPIPEAYKHFTERNPAGVEKAFKDQWESMMSAIGAPIMQAALPIMRSLTGMFETIGTFANQNPEAVKAVAIGLAGLGAALAVLGTAAVIGALVALAPLGAIAAGLVALGAAVGALAYYNWTSISAGLQSVYDAVLKFSNDLNALGRSIENFILPKGNQGIPPDESGGRYYKPSRFDSGG
jgi:hypothetical protein